MWSLLRVLQRTFLAEAQERLVQIDRQHLIIALASLYKQRGDEVGIQVNCLQKVRPNHLFHWHFRFVLFILHLDINLHGLHRLNFLALFFFLVVFRAQASNPAVASDIFHQFLRISDQRRQSIRT